MESMSLNLRKINHELKIVNKKHEEKIGVKSQIFLIKKNFETCYLVLNYFLLKRYL